MMKRSASCFKVCGSGEEDGDYRSQLRASAQGKGSSDRRGWSFRRKSSSQRVLTHTVISNTPSGYISSDFEAMSHIATEKSSTMSLTNEEAKLAIIQADVVDATVYPVDALCNLEESSVACIQSAIRSFLARRELAKLKMVVKLQATIRGHLVRRRAVGALHCIQGIVKMQALVRARFAKPPGSSENTDRGVDKQTSIEKEGLSSAPKIDVTFNSASMDKLLYNSFARRLLESTPSAKHLYIKCDPSRPSPAWIWMERWMSFASTSLDGPEISKQAKKAEKLSSDFFEILESKGFVNASVQAPVLSSPEHENGQERFNPDTLGIIHGAFQNTLSDTRVLEELQGLNVDTATNFDQSEKNLAFDSLSLEGKKSVSRYGKASNPSFIEVQAKFRELTSTGSENGERGSDLKTASNDIPVPLTTMEFSLSNHTPSFLVGSECDNEQPLISDSDSLDETYFDLPETMVLAHKGTLKVEGTPTVITNGVSSLNKDALIASVKKESDSSKADNVMGEKKIIRSRSGMLVRLNAEKDQQFSRISFRESPPLSQGTRSQITRSGKTNNSGSRKRWNSLSSGKKSTLSTARNSNGSDSERLHHWVDTRRSSFGSNTSDLDRRDSCDCNPLPSYMKATESVKAKILASTSARLSPNVYDLDVGSASKRHSVPGAPGRKNLPKLLQSKKGSGSSSQERKGKR